MTSLSLLPAFTDETTDSQEVFRHILKAMSEPGTILDIDPVSVPANSRYSKKIGQNKLSCLWSVAQTLLDSDCSVFVYPSISDNSFIQSLVFYTGVSIARDVKEADFIFMSMDELKDINEFNLGGIEKPHLSNTALLYVEAITVDAQIALSGPGIKGSQSLTLAGLDEEKASLLQNNHSLYPCGIDFIFCSDTKMTAIPRSTKISIRNINTETTTNTTSHLTAEIN
jgi:alpha-D-ribose 1-methylphosphonate 5-triphosphate synthase subunit PhnH